MEGQHYSEQQLDAFARSGPDGNAAAHLLHCERCRKIFEFLRSYYAEADQTFRGPLTRQAEDFVPQERSTRIIVLHPFAAQPDTTAIGVSQRTIVLAAQSGQEAPEVHEIEELTYAAQPEGILVRVIRNNVSKHWTLYVLAEKEEHRRHVLLVVSSEKGTDQCALTDAEGIASLTATVSVPSQDLVLTLRLPDKIMTIDGALDGAMIVSDNDVSAVIQTRPDLVSVALQNERAPRFAKAAIVFSDGSSSLQDVAFEQFSVQTQSPAHVAELRLFV